MLDPSLRAILVCPLDHQPLRDEPQALVCTGCGRRYLIIDDIPVMLLEETAPGERQDEG